MKDNRETVTVFIAPLKDKMCVHFCSTKLQGNDVWMLLPENIDTFSPHWLVEQIRNNYQNKDVSNAVNPFFKAIEEIMVINNVANNVSNIRFLRLCGDAGVELVVLYNKSGV